MANNTTDVTIASHQTIVAFIIWMTIQAVAGSIGNALILVYYPIKSKQGTYTGMFIWNLALIDFLASMLVIPYTITFELKIVQNPAICKLCEALRYTIVSGSLLTLIGVAVERFYLIRKPNEHIKTHHLKALTIGTVVICLATGIPAAFAYEVYEMRLTEKIHMAPVQLTCYIGDSLVAKVYSSTLFVIFAAIFVILFILYASMFGNIIRFIRNRRRLTGPKVSIAAITTAEMSQFGGTSLSPNEVSFEKPQPSPPTADTSSEHDSDTTNQSGSNVNLHPSNVKVTPSKPHPPSRPSICFGEADKRNRGDSVRVLGGATRYPDGNKFILVQIRGATMLLGVTVVFVLSWLPFWLTKLGVVSYDPFRHYMFFLNHVSNFFIYIFFNKKFRDRLAKCCKRQPCCDI